MGILDSLAINAILGSSFLLKNSSDIHVCYDIEMTDEGYYIYFKGGFAPIGNCFFFDTVRNKYLHDGNSDILPIQVLP